MSELYVLFRLVISEELLLVVALVLMALLLYTAWRWDGLALNSVELRVIAWGAAQVALFYATVFANEHGWIEMPLEMSVVFARWAWLWLLSSVMFAVIHASQRQKRTA